VQVVAPHSSVARFSHQPRYTSASRRARQLAGAKAKPTLMSGREEDGRNPLPACLPRPSSYRSLVARCLLLLLLAAAHVAATVSLVLRAALICFQSVLAQSEEEWMCRCFTASPSHSLPLPKASEPPATSRRAFLPWTSRVKYVASGDMDAAARFPRAQESRRAAQSRAASVEARARLPQAGKVEVLSAVMDARRVVLVVGTGSGTGLRSLTRSLSHSSPH
jgi:hypothetical protein